MLRCSEWWVKEQARRRRIPFAWIGGSYLFTPEHLAEIVRRFEVRPTDDTTSAPAQRRTSAQRVATGEAGSVVHLTARPPRRSRDSQRATAA